MGLLRSTTVASRAERRAREVKRARCSLGGVLVTEERRQQCLKKKVCRRLAWLLPVRPTQKTRRRRTASCGGLPSPRGRKTPASQAEASSTASCRSSTDLVASTTIGGPVDTTGRRGKTRNMLLTRASTGLEVRLPHLASNFFCADSSRKPAARVRCALPNLTAVDVDLYYGRLVPSHMILAATSIACLGRQHQQQQ